MPINNPTRDIVVLTALSNIIYVGTRVPQSRVYIQNRYQLQTSAFPAILLMSGNQTYTRDSAHEYLGTLQVKICYYDHWEQNGDQAIDDIWANIAQDLEIIKGNIESNESLTYQNQAYAVSCPHMTLSPYEGLFDNSFPGVPVLYRTLTATFNILPYFV